MTEPAFPTAAEVAAGALAAAREADPDRLRKVVRDYPNAVAAKIARHELERRGLEIEPDAGTTSVRVGIVVEHPGGLTADLAAVSVNAVVVSKRAGNVTERQAVADDLAAHLRRALREWMTANPGVVWDDYAGLFTVDPSRLTR